ncbi:hypothetical protein P8A21_20160 [Streptomyces poriferorum]|uniref:Uncharacterized protein n=1 Tax=Streptomyces poriferorum TaxID=2798799 RepID=A0ABY9IQK5_9ACTN|nr:MULTISPECIES: hypothetical protein [Streptomyces]MDP5313385.1 hypothetical protein [Streptomyces sp. Alt4]WLQ49664.1 hypothetical protein P8A21_20160 [Streptomyces sp. Alt1]WLQ57633.1 hypothetical protein P8A19_20310 [Streptomyces sp. Alt2]WSI64477.1 hypothetical protein OG471_21570 [Streptomyces sp. NBC_01336]
MPFPDELGPLLVVDYRLKQRLALSVPDLLDYGQIKAPATEILMAAAERWAAGTGWGE